MQSILNELRRRNVFRVAAAYAVVAWVMGQGANLILPTFEAPDWVLKVVVALLLIGFPIVVILTWAYELTPEGLRRTPAPGEEKGSRSNARLVDSIMIVALVVTVITVTAMNADWSAGETGLEGSAESGGRIADGVAMRTAVLPVIGVNTDPSTELLALGLTDDLISRLGGLRGLELVGAASSFSYAGTKATLEDVGKRLGVSRILQGSLRKNDGRVAVHVQLVSVPEGKELWSAELQGAATDLLELRNAVVTKLARHLGMQGPESGVEEGADPPGEAAVYEDWLRLLGHLRKGGEKNLQQARVLAQQLTTRAPKFGEGYAALAFVSIAGGASAEFADREDAVSSSRMLLDQALTLSPQSRRVLDWRARVESVLFRRRGRKEDFDRIEADLRHALELFPGNPALMTSLADHCAAWGEYARSIELARRAIKLDPRSERAHAVLVESLIALGRYDAAQESVNAMREVFPAADAPLRYAAQIAAARGELDEALGIYAKISTPDREAVRMVARIHASRRDREAAVDSLSRWPDGPADALERDIWRTALEQDAAAAFALAEESLAPVGMDDAALLGRLGVQSGRPARAIEYFDRFFADWINDPGPLLGETAWINAPWFAYALKKSGRDGDARRLLDRHLAGLLVMEGRLHPAARELYLAANYAVQGRDGDALKAMERSAGHGLRLTWSALGAPIALNDTVLLEPLPENPAFNKLLSRLDQSNGGGKKSARN